MLIYFCYFLFHKGTLSFLSGEHRQLPALHESWALYTFSASGSLSRTKPHVYFGNSHWPLAGQYFRGCGCGAPSSFQVYLLIYGNR